jgi:hypothetical protein
LDAAQAAAIVNVLNAALADLGLEPGREVVRAAVGKHLRTLAKGD